jgi:hypothetical protein
LNLTPEHTVTGLRPVDFTALFPVFSPQNTKSAYKAQVHKSMNITNDPEFLLEPLRLNSAPSSSEELFKRNLKKTDRIISRDKISLDR